MPHSRIPHLSLSFLSLLLLLTPTITATATNTFKEKCLGFKPATRRNTTLTRLEYVAAGTNLGLPENEPSCNRAAQAVAVDLCRVAFEVPTSGRSGFKFEIWLPEIWSGRTLATGNGGLDGCIKYEDLAYGSANGFSTFGTNNGHDGPSGEAFYQNEDVVIDFSWRALHTSVEIGKELTALFYDDKVGKSYYLGCSLGGRQGIGGALKFPDDFDGVVAGAPAVDFNSLYAWRASFYTITGDAGASSSSPGFVSAETWKTTVHDEVLRQCDAIDGVEDGIIEDPILCHVDVDKLLCDPPTTTNNGNSTPTSCLTAAQATVVKAVFADYLWPNGTLLYPRPNPGSELLASDGLYSGNPYQPSADWFRYAVLGSPAWDPATYTRADAQRAVAADPGSIATWPTAADLAPFRARGGKILSYHGQQDQQISSLNSVRFWTRLRNDGDDGDSPDAFYRLFRVPGMNHCSGGPGAWTVGQGGSTPAYAIPFEKGYNVLAAVVDWVEEGVAPEAIVGTKFVDDDVAKGVAYRHRHCRYPFRSTYLGQGDPLDVDSWRCVDFGPY